MKFKRASGVLMHISSLPGDCGIGTFGREAYRFVDFLESAGQSYWQILPLCPTSYGDSPYQSFSTFAGNPYFIDLEILCEQGYITKKDYEDIKWCEDKTRVDYDKLYEGRNAVFKKVQEGFEKNTPKDYSEFCESNAFWLDDYALFMAVKDAHGGAQYTLWEEDIKKREPFALEKWSRKCREKIGYYKILQYLFFKQWFELKSYANEKGIKIIGDLPIYVAADSADVWADPKQFKLDKNLNPKVVAGCPPDAFSQDGQLWGNPVYNWRYMRFDRYSWWIKRLEMSLFIYDVIRIDHFRGFEGFYTVKYGQKNAKQGKWCKGPSMNFWKCVKLELGDIPVIAEDLGFLTKGVHRLLKLCGFPGMKVLQFAFDSREESDYLPHKYTSNCVVYTGTHDNNTLIGWLSEIGKDDLEFAKKYLDAETEDEIPEKVIISAMSSVADLCILTMQDLIGLSTEARMNTPSTVGNNWKWRATQTQINSEIAERLYSYTEVYGRKGQK